MAHLSFDTLSNCRPDDSKGFSGCMGFWPVIVDSSGTVVAAGKALSSGDFPFVPFALRRGMNMPLRIMQRSPSLISPLRVMGYGDHIAWPSDIAVSGAVQDDMRSL